MQRVRPYCKTAPVKAAMDGAPLSFSVVGEKEYAQWRDVAYHDSVQAAEQAKAQKEELLKASQDRVSNWPNTIEALRRRKEKARTDRLEAEEERKKVIDAHEADLARAKRKANIDKANLMLYETDDRVKNFTSKMVLASVLEERAKQIDMKKKKEEAQFEHEMKWAVLQEETLRRATKEEEEKQVALRSRAKKFKEDQMEQLNQVMAIKIGELKANKEEGKRIMQAAKDAVEEEIREEQKRREQAEKVKAELVEANENQKQLKAVKKQKEVLEAEQIEKFAQNKEQQLAERKRRIEQRFATQMKHRQEIIDRQAAHLKALKDAQVERELKQIHDFERERDAKEARDAEKRKEFWEDIVKSRTQQQKRKDLDAARAAAEIERARQMWQIRSNELVEEEVHDRIDSKHKAIDVQRFQIMQQQERSLQKAKEREEKRLEALMVKKAMQDDDEMFKGYVNAVMSEYVKAGKTPVNMKVE
eukprot:PhF_6_TR20515/c2_g1_i1/m.29580